MLARDGATVLIDTISLEYMGGSEIDFVDDLMGQSFQIKNPHRRRLLRLRHQLFDLDVSAARISPSRENLSADGLMTGRSHWPHCGSSSLPHPIPRMDAQGPARQ